MMLLLFCEQFWFEDHEYLSAFSSLFFSIISVFVLLVSDYNNAFYKWLLSHVNALGIGSFALHWTKSNFNGVMDVVPMLLVIFMANYTVMRVLLVRLFQKWNFWHEKLDDMAAIALSLLETFCIAAYYGSSYDLPLLFGGPSVLMSVMVLIYVIWVYIQERNNIPDKKIFIYVTCGQVAVLAAAILWIGTEPRCNYNTMYIERYWLAYVPSHALWHTCLAFGTYYEVMFVQYVELWDTRYDSDNGWGFLPILKTSENRLLSFCLHILPVVQLGPRMITTSSNV